MDALQDSPVRPHWLFTSETARINAFKANKAIAEAKERQAALEREKDAQARDAVKAVDPSIVFRDLTVTRVRAQISILLGKLDALLSKPTLDTKAVKEASEAITRLEAVEQKLSGRASPGSLRPRSEKPSRRVQADPEVE